MSGLQRNSPVIRLVTRDGHPLDVRHQDPEEDLVRADRPVSSPEWFALEVAPQDGVAEWIRVWQAATRLVRALQYIVALIALVIVIWLLRDKHVR
jgi:hypothetical protein